jgi:hypothetical protein
VLAAHSQRRFGLVEGQTDGEGEHGSLAHLALHLDIALHRLLHTCPRQRELLHFVACVGVRTRDSFLLMARPRPEPPNLRPTLASSWEKLYRERERERSSRE